MPPLGRLSAPGDHGSAATMKILIIQGVKDFFEVVNPALRTNNNLGWS